MLSSHERLQVNKAQGHWPVRQQGYPAHRRCKEETHQLLVNRDQLRDWAAPLEVLGAMLSRVALASCASS